MANVAYSADIQDLRGKVGTNVFSKACSGSTVRIRTSGKNPRTPAQSAVRLNLAKGSAAYKSLTLPQIAAWQTYAATQTKHNPVSGKSYTPTANTVYVGLASKFLQINPTGTIPTTPPAASFVGDTIAATATGAVGQVTFTATAANAANVKTELLLQPLKSRTRAPGAKGYRTKAFVAFAAGPGLISNVTVPTGFYAPAYRFVNTVTGQDTNLLTLPVVQVS